MKLFLEVVEDGHYCFVSGAFHEDSGGDSGFKFWRTGAPLKLSFTLRVLEFMGQQALSWCFSLAMVDLRLSFSNA